MAGAIDMSLDDLITKSKQHSQRLPRGRPVSGGGPVTPRRRFNNTRAAATPYHHNRSGGALSRPQLPARMPPMAYGGFGTVAAVDTPTKLYISNLDYAVSNDDIKELFADVGELKRYSINYDRSGRSKGTAEVVFSRRSDALAAVKRYNNVQLDGKPMKIEIIGTNIDPQPPVTALAFRPLPGNFNLPFKSGPGAGRGGAGWPRGGGRFVGRGGFAGRGGFNGRGQGGFDGPGQGRGGRGRGRGGRGDQKVSTEDLDAELDKYHAEAMQTR